MFLNHRFNFALIFEIFEFAVNNFFSAKYAPCVSCSLLHFVSTKMKFGLIFAWLKLKRKLFYFLLQKDSLHLFGISNYAASAGYCTDQRNYRKLMPVIKTTFYLPPPISTQPPLKGYAATIWNMKAHSSAY